MDNNKHTCNICYKDYKSPQSLWNHKKIYHENNISQPQNNSILPQKTLN